jgi:phosphotransferase system HPr (HPr) family protein
LKLTLQEALHARPANLFVRVASGFAAIVEVRKGERAADAKNILEVLTLGAATGDAIELSATGDDAEAAIAALARLVERNFDADLVPETGAAAAPGVAVGAALVIDEDEPAPDAARAEGADASVVDAREQAAFAFAEVRRDLEALLQSLPAEEAALFEPEIAILAALEPPVASRVARGEPFEGALDAELAATGALVTGRQSARAVSDLVRDARVRLRVAYSGESRTNLAERLAAAPPGDVVLVARELTPSLVSALPRRVSGIIAAEPDPDAEGRGTGYASHAAILARGRDLPLLFVAEHVAEGIASGDVVVLDTRAVPAQLWTSPNDARIAEAREQVAYARRARREAEQAGAAPLAHLAVLGGAPFAVRVNIGTTHDYVPRASDGVGLVRTELLHAGKKRAPSVEEQWAALALVADKIDHGPLVVRLFDGGGDKPLAWLPAPQDAPEARGIALLARHGDVLRSQVAAIARAGAHADARILIPIVERASDVREVRALAPAGLAVGAMIESERGVAAANEIAGAADFICVGTNDLSAAILGQDRSKMAALPIDARVLAAISAIVQAAHGAGRAVTVCGEMAGEPEGALVLAGLGVDAVSVAPSRFAPVREALAAASASSCSKVAELALGKGKATP